ncbi:MAG TPA: hypothetical protein VE999_18630 [Gemmataceae bacterium]|nr:hypothetical protein [Gemmataceae bacterium]
MNTHAEVIKELRDMFKHGATPSRLIRHIVESHTGERNIHSLIQAYFREAFGIPIVRGLNPIDDYQHDDLRYAFLNEQLVHEMIQRRSEWDGGTADGTREVGSWLDSVTASDDKQRLRNIQSVNLPDLSECWSRLTPDEQHYIQRSLASAHGLYEMVKVLSRLVECLQRRLDEVEAKC